MIPHVPSAEVLVGVISKDLLILGTVEDRPSNAHHGANSGDLRQWSGGRASGGRIPVPRSGMEQHKTRHT